MAYLLACALWMVIGSCDLLAFDQVVRRLRASNPLGWKDEGSPAGFFFVPPDSSLIARANCSFRWAVRLPTWAAANPEIEKALRVYRSLSWLTLGFPLVLVLWMALR